MAFMAPDVLSGLPEDVQKRVRRAEQPVWFPPMLATLTDKPFSREGWLFEPKFDGERCLAFRRKGSVELLSRNRKLLNSKYPELAEAFEEQEAASFITDGEIVAWENGVSSFTKLQERMQVQNPSSELRKKVPVCFQAFDLLYFEGFDLRQMGLRYRKRLLRDAIRFRRSLRYTEHRETKGEAYFREACRNRWEGIIAKDGDGVYVSGRSREWLKFKCVQGQEFVIGGYTDPEGQRVEFGALLVGYYEQGVLHYAGKVGTGFDTITLRRLGKRFAGLETSRSPFEADGLPHKGVHWLKPKLVAQIGFTEWTNEGKLRHPRFLGLRDDKSPDEVVREKAR
jgi:bifunctional non-homologous end joining protein LigD